MRNLILKTTILLLFSFSSVSLFSQGYDVLKQPVKIQKFYKNLESYNGSDKKSFLLATFNFAIQNNDDTLKVISSYELSSYYYQHIELANDSAKYYALLCDGLQQNIHLPEKNVYNKTLLAIIYLTKNKLDSSLYYCNQSEMIINKYEREVGLRAINSLYGVKFHVLINMMEYEEALNLMEKIEYYAQKSNEFYDLVKVELAYAKLYNEVGDNKNEIKHLQKALRIHVEPDIREYSLYNMLGQAYENFNIDSCIYYYEKCLTLSEEKFNFYTNSTHFQLSNIAINHNLIEKSKYHFNQLDTNKIKQQLPCQFEFLKAKLTDRIDDKEALCLKAINCNPSLKIKKEIYQYLNTVFKKNELKESLYFKKLSLVKDSLNTQNRKSEIQKSLLRKKLKEQENVIDNTQEELKSKNSEIKFYFLGLLVLTVILILLLFFIKRYYSKGNTLEKEKNILKEEIKKKEKLLEDASLSIEKNIKFIEKTHKDISEEKVELSNLKSEINIYLDRIKKNEGFNSSIEKIQNDFFKSLDISFTPTERKIIMLLKIDLSSKEIADALNVKLTSVEKYRYNIRRKFNLSSKESLQNYIKKL